jgi:hypothetical protein
VHLRSELEGLAAGAGAGVDDSGGRRVDEEAEELAALVLKLEEAFAEARQREGVEARLEEEPERGQWRRSCFDPFTAESLAELLAGGPEEVDAGGERGALVHGRRLGLGPVAELAEEAFGEEVGERGVESEALRAGECPDGVGRGGQRLEKAGLVGPEAGRPGDGLGGLAVEDTGGGEPEQVLLGGGAPVEGRARALEEGIDGALPAKEGVDALGHGTTLVGVQVALRAENVVQRAVGEPALVADGPVGLQGGLRDEVLPQRPLRPLEGA